MRCNTNNTRGFTLTELLIVIGIITVLASILMPALSKAREKANAAVCTSNLKQLGEALHMYADNNDGFVATSSVFHEEKSWLGLMKPYYVNPGVLLCREDDEPYVLETLTPQIRASYGYSVDVAWSGRRLSSFRKSSRILAFADSEGPHINNDKMLPPEGGGGLFGMDKQWALGYRHDVNFVALDGHVESRKYIAPDDPVFTEVE
jgi:prepilin-type N-terminal cleavage/methylation domain-containing protein